VTTQISLKEKNHHPSLILKVDSQLINYNHYYINCH